MTDENQADNEKPKGGKSGDGSGGKGSKGSGDKPKPAPELVDVVIDRSFNQYSKGERVSVEAKTAKLWREKNLAQSADR